MPDRFYLTTSIAYANNKPGVHTLYEVIGADVIARWYRMQGVETRFLTGTDEHSINIAQSALDEGRTAREFVDEKVALFKTAEGALQIASDRFIRTTDPDHIRAAQEMVRRAHANGDIYLGTYEGWYCPNEGFRNATDVVETARGTICPNHPDVPLQWLTEKNWFFRLSAYQERLERHFADHPDFVQPDFRRNEMLGFIRGGLEDFSISRERTPGGWGIPFPIAENGEPSLREDGSWGPEAGVIYVWYDALINYITGVGFPDDMPSFEQWWPADLHIIGKDIARFHTIFWPAMLWSAGLEAPRHVWVHGFLLAAGGERMSKSRGNFLDPADFVAAFGSDGARYVVLREVPFDRDAEVSWDSFVRRYNADLANDFGNLVNRTVSMTNRYLDGERPAPRAVGESPLAEGWADTLRAYGERLEGYLLHEALAGLWEFVGGANKVVDAEKPWELAKAAKEGDEAAAARLRGVLGDLLEACRLVGLAVAPYMPGMAPRVLGQLGYAYEYGVDGNGGPPILDQLVWGARAGESGRVTAPEPLFPRLDVDAEAP
jgi:methionyl-tRNA synthetase